MNNVVVRFVAFWFVNCLVLWVASEIFASVKIDNWQTLLISGLLFGIAHALLKPILVVLTLPITIITLGLFLLVINAALLLLVAWLVPGFHVAGFWQAVLVGLFISVFSFVLNLMLGRPSESKD